MGRLESPKIRFSDLCRSVAPLRCAPLPADVSWDTVQFPRAQNHPVVPNVKVFGEALWSRGERSAEPPEHTGRGH